MFILSYKHGVVVLASQVQDLEFFKVLVPSCCYAVLRSRVVQRAQVFGDIFTGMSAGIQYPFMQIKKKKFWYFPCHPSSDTNRYTMFNVLIALSIYILMLHFTIYRSASVVEQERYTAWAIGLCRRNAFMFGSKTCGSSDIAILRQDFSICSVQYHLISYNVCFCVFFYAKHSQCTLHCTMYTL